MRIPHARPPVTEDTGPDLTYNEISLHFPESLGHSQCVHIQYPIRRGWICDGRCADTAQKCYQVLHHHSSTGLELNHSRTGLEGRAPHRSDMSQHRTSQAVTGGLRECGKMRAYACNVSLRPKGWVSVWVMPQRTQRTIYGCHESPCPGGPAGADHRASLRRLSSGSATTLGATPASHIPVSERLQLTHAGND